MSNSNKKFVSYLLANATEAMGVEDAQKAAVTLSLDTLATAFYQGTRKPKEHQFVGGEFVEVKDPLTLKMAERISMGDFVVIYNTDDGRIHYVTQLDGAIVSVYYSMNPGFNFYTVISTDKEVLEKLGVKAQSTSDLRVIAHIFGFKPPVEEKVVPVEEPAPAILPEVKRRMVWHRGQPAEDVPVATGDAPSATEQTKVQSAIILPESAKA